MKTQLLSFVMLTAGLFTACNLNAQTANLPYYESFDYTVGERLITEGGTAGLGIWQALEGTSNDPTIMTSPEWTLPTDLAAATGAALTFSADGDNPFISITSQDDASTTLYTSLMFKITEQALTTNDSSNPFFLSYFSTAWVGTVFIQRVSDTEFQLGISESTNRAKAVYTTDTYDVGDELFLVSSYTAGNNVQADAVAKLWVNPIVNGTEQTPTITSTIDTDPRVGINKVYFVQAGSDATQTPTIIIDELRVANTWSDVLYTTATSTTLSVKDNVISNFSLYPNPAKDYITVETNQIPVLSVDMYNILGAQVMANKPLIDNRLNVSGLNNGVYLMKINTTQGSVTKKIVISN